MLEKLSLPEDLKKLGLKECEELCREIRKRILYAVDKNGGHLASNLGMVELTLAMHRVFDSPEDRFIFDVGHQSYTHKILTGRNKDMSRLRRKGGISGFTKPSESVHDAFVSGHSSNSVSAACGISRAMYLKGDSHHVIAVIGDGALTGGLAYEGLNNIGRSTGNLILILNDNEMSISKNVGAVSKHLSALRGQKSYITAKKAVEKALDSTPVIGGPIKSLMLTSKDTIRFFLYRAAGYNGPSMFENMGFTYLGPVNGHDLRELEQYLEAAKAIGKPVVVHVKTKKGKGYKPAEENPGAFHALKPGELRSAAAGEVSDDSFSAVMGRELSSLADSDRRICAITAAMKYGTGLNSFAADHPERFFDVGIAEGHAVTFAAGLATQGMIPVFAVYSSFLQRSFDELIHDTAIENTHIVLCVDRAGLTGEDGQTHQGVFDIPMLTSIPGTTIYSPASYAEMKACLYAAVYDTDGIAAVRYPKGTEVRGLSPAELFSHRKYGSKTLFIGFGKVGGILEKCGIKAARADTLRLVKVFPIEKEIMDICMKYKSILIFEESLENGGIGQLLLSELMKAGFRGKVRIRAVSGFVAQASSDEQLELFGLDENSINEALNAT